MVLNLILKGLVFRANSTTNDKNVAKYLTPEIVNSPFNKMPNAGTNKSLLMFEKDYFLSLSWMIAELGKLKDEGLGIVVLDEADNKYANDATDTTAILSKATEICQTFLAEKNLDKLIVGIVKIK